MDCHILFNPNAGMAPQALPTLQGFSNSTGASLHTPETAHALERVFRDLVSLKDTRIIIAGGDGTINRAVNAADSLPVIAQIALVPLGTGNDLARSLDIPRDDIDAALDLAINSAATPIDLVRISNGAESLAINAVTIGFGAAQAAGAANAGKRRWGPPAYWKAALLQEHLEYTVCLEIGAERIREPAVGLTIANGRYVGGGFPIAPWALLNDGLLDVTIITRAHTLELLSAGLDLVLDQDHQPDGSITHRAPRISVSVEPEAPFSIDGEPQTRRETSFEIIPDALRIVTGPNAALR